MPEDDCPEPLRTDIDISRPRYDEESYIGRVGNCFFKSFPFNILASKCRIATAKDIVEKYKAKNKLCITEGRLWWEKQLYDSAYNPETGEEIPLERRTSVHIPTNILILGGMMIYYKSVLALIFWQWIYQTFNTSIFYVNREKDSKITDEYLAQCYGASTVSAVITALGLSVCAKRFCFSQLARRFIPLAAVAVGNSVSVPLMRYDELQDGIAVKDGNGKEIAKSQYAACKATADVILHRIIMVMPLMMVPYIMNHYVRRGTICRYPWTNVPFTLFYTGLALTLVSPLFCAIVPENGTVRYCELEPEVQKKLSDKNQILTYNRGL